MKETAGFFSANKDVAPAATYITKRAAQLQTEKPELSVSEALKIVSDEVRKTVEIPSILTMF